jgi:hypothetical protein
MTIHDYIKKHGLTLWKTWPTAANLQNPWIPSFFIERDSEKFPHGDKFEIYSNAERTRFVSMNVTREMFRIVHYELLLMKSDWQPSQSNFEIQRI